MAKDIKGSHFILGDGKNDYNTTSSLTLNFDKDKAIEAKGRLKDELKNDLRATHYKLGYDSSNNKMTTNMLTYVPVRATDKIEKTLVSDELRKSHFNLNNSINSQIGKSIYMSDFTKKDISVDN